MSLNHPTDLRLIRILCRPPDQVLFSNHLFPLPKPRFLQRPLTFSLLELLHQLRVFRPGHIYD